MKTSFRNFITLAFMSLIFMGVSAQELSHNKFYIRPYYSSNWGVTTSFGVPAETRETQSSSLKYNYIFGCDFATMFSDKWGLSTGLRYERKASGSRVVMKNFYTTITMAGEGTPTHGYFSGTVENCFDNKYLTLPVMALYRASKKWDIRWGMYFSYALSRSYKGTATDGKIRESPMVAAIGVNNSTTDFSNDVNTFDMGIQVGAIYTIWKNLDINFDINWGLLNVLDSPDSGMTMNVYNLYFDLGIGWKFGLGHRKSKN